MPPKGCPIKFEGKCKRCPLDPWKRVERCKYYRRQVISGVPWHWGADERYISTEEEWQKLRSKALEIDSRSP